MTVVKNQHYVAQGYLRAFANANERLFVFDKKEQNVFHAGVRNVASEKFFYDLPPVPGNHGGDPQFIEKFLAQTVDTDFPLAIKALVDEVEQQGRIDVTLKDPLSYFLAIQLLRTRAKRNLLRQLSGLLTAELETRGAATGGPLNPERFRLDEKQAAMVQSQFFLDPSSVREIAAALCGHIWVVGISRTGQEFYTSDNPVARTANGSFLGQGMLGLASRGIQITLPLTPKYALLLLERSFFSGVFGRFDLQAVRFTDQGVIGCNIMQVLSSRRQVYSLVDNFAIARDFCATHPDTCNPDRVEIEVISGGEPTEEE